MARYKRKIHHCSISLVNIGQKGTYSKDKVQAKQNGNSVIYIPFFFYLLFLFKVAHYILKYILKSAGNYLIMIESLMNKMNISQIGEQMQSSFQKLSLVKINN